MNEYENTFYPLTCYSFTTSALAYDKGRLTVTFASKSNVQVMIDNRIYNGDDNTVVLNNIRPGQHTIQIYKARKNGNGSNGNNRADLLYSSIIYVKSGYDVHVMINRFGKALLDEQSIYNRGHWDNWGSYSKESWTAKSFAGALTVL